MTVRIIGDGCSAPDCMAPVVSHGLCSRHYRLAAAFRRLADPEPEPEILDHQSLEFGRELDTWRAE